MDFKRIDIKTGYSCNNNCRFCMLGDKRRTMRNRTTHECEQELDLAKKKGAEKVLLTGGEPTIRKDIFDLVAYAKRLGFRTIHIESNGRMFSYPEITKRMMDAGANSFSISLHAHEPRLYAYITRTSEEAFQQAMDGIRNLTERGGNISLNSVIVKPNYRYLSEIVRIASGFRLSVNFPFINPFGSVWRDREEMVPTLTEIRPHLHSAIDLANRNDVFATTEMIPFCFMQGYEKHIAEPNLPDIEIRAIEYSEDFNEMRKSSRIKAEKCKKCKKYMVCEGISRHYAKFKGTSELKPIS